MKKMVFAVLLLGACGGLSEVPAEVPDMLSPPDTLPAEEAPPEEIGEAGGSLPPGFYQRGCQWDNPACGPTPGVRPVMKMEPDDR